MALPPILVLVAPQDIVNIGSAVRVAKNFGLDQVRLVRPACFDAYRIEGIAHNTGDLIQRIRLADTLAEAIADCVWTVGLTARERSAKRTVLRPGPAAAELVARAEAGPVAFVVGREDKGLLNEELDLCHALVTIPTNPDYRSLNLAQAVAVMSYETWLARGGERHPLKPPRKPAPPASVDLLERLFADWARALAAIEFFKTREPEHVMRSLREVLHRADLDAREASLIRAMGIEVVRFLERRGLHPAPLEEPPRNV
ncbi:MAG TPA: TrmJ/YjtD family RNA methyltransferase [Gemmatimonadales bacterium]|jgi:TrmH family RNA methyltransferase|nr:TrmJ/YjtD family RNA methyltransferase [Gemmatimonadales bacterium]